MNIPDDRVFSLVARCAKFDYLVERLKLLLANNSNLRVELPNLLHLVDSIPETP